MGKRGIEQMGTTAGTGGKIMMDPVFRVSRCGRREPMLGKTAISRSFSPDMADTCICIGLDWEAHINVPATTACGAVCISIFSEKKINEC